MGIFKIEDNNLKRQINLLLEKLFPINRSLTGDGNLKTLEILNEIIPLNIKYINSGEKVFDWTIPKVWNLTTAYVKDSSGKKIVDFSENNLHVVNYSIPVNKKVTFEELEPHLHTLKNLPNAIPYRTSYYKEDWGFCIEYEKFLKLDKNETYEVFIDSKLENKSMVYADFTVKGKTNKEYAFSTYFCHPSMANDNLSGLIIQTFLASMISKQNPYYSYRFIFVPETIGAITYCSLNTQIMKDIEAGFILSNVGGPGNFSFKESFDNEHYINFAIEQAFKNLNLKYKTYPFDIHGSDERQYSSINFRINMPSVHKDKYYEYEEYHTSLDNLDFVNSDNLTQSFYVYKKIIDIIESNRTYINNKTECEVHLGKYDLYPKMSGHINQIASGEKNEFELDQILWLLFLCDGKKSILEISKHTNFDPIELFNIAEKLKNKGILSVAK
tara:strand:+ start:1131 stop:2456 length:1326 start_codon:yes stop_codon:yes gene_type:complete